MQYLVEHVMSGKRYKEGDFFELPLRHCQLRKINAIGSHPSFTVFNCKTEETTEIDTTVNLFYRIIIDEQATGEPKLVFSTKKEMVEIEIEQARITLSDAEVREMVVRCVREKYPDIAATHDIEILSIVPCMETDVRIWRKI